MGAERYAGHAGRGGPERARAGREVPRRQQLLRYQRSDSPPLHAVKEGDSGGNGVFAYTATSAFPTSSYQSTNYWVDIVFATTP